jgi:hypothetical protein
MKVWTRFIWLKVKSFVTHGNKGNEPSCSVRGIEFLEVVSRSQEGPAVWSCICLAEHRDSVEIVKVGHYVISWPMIWDQHQLIEIMFMVKLQELILESIVAYLLKTRTVAPEKQPLLANGSETALVSMQRLGKHVPAATDTRATIEVLLETVYSTRSMKRGYKKDNWGNRVSSVREFVKEECFSLKGAAVERGLECVKMKNLQC